jgi:hypothetical protein
LLLLQLRNWSRLEVRRGRSSGRAAKRLRNLSLRQAFALKERALVRLLRADHARVLQEADGVCEEVFA